jgi:hypothetical protein
MTFGKGTSLVMSVKKTGGKNWSNTETFRRSYVVVGALTSGSILMSTTGQLDGRWKAASSWSLLYKLFYSSLTFWPKLVTIPQIEMNTSLTRKYCTNTENARGPNIEEKIL